MDEINTIERPAPDSDVEQDPPMVQGPPPTQVQHTPNMEAGGGHDIDGAVVPTTEPRKKRALTDRQLKALEEGRKARVVSTKIKKERFDQVQSRLVAIENMLAQAQAQAQAQSASSSTAGRRKAAAPRAQKAPPKPVAKPKKAQPMSMPVYHDPYQLGNTDPESESEDDEYWAPPNPYTEFTKFRENPQRYIPSAAPHIGHAAAPSPIDHIANMISW